MPKILVNKAFNLILRANSDKLSFAPGLHDVDDDVAAHWYVQQHATILGGDVVPPAADDSDGRRVLIERLVALFRLHIEDASIDVLAQMLESSEAAHASKESVAGEEPQDVQEAAQVDAAEPAEAIEAEGGKELPPADAVEPVAPTEATSSGSVEPVVEPETAEVAEAAPEFDPALVEAMTHDELRAYITERDGKAPHHKLGHDKLVALALAPAAGETAEPIEAEGEEA